MNRPLFVTLAGGYLLLMAGLGFFVAPRLFDNKTHHAAPATALAVAETATPSPPPSATSAPSPTPVAELPASPYPVSRLIIPDMGVNSSWAPLGFLADGLTMASPAGPRDLGWYSFSGAPGEESNAIFAGHVDWYTGAPAIFAGLTSLKPGAKIEVSRADGKLRTYKVESSTWYDFLSTDASPIIAPTTTPTLTLITCGGDFNGATHEYDKRLVVRAVAGD